MRTARPTLLLIICAFLFIFAGTCKEVVIRKFDVKPLYVCTGERITFEWDIKNVDRIKIYKNGNDKIHEENRKGSWTSGVVQSDWDFVRFKGCQRDRCESFSFDVHIIDNPKWTRYYV